VYAVECRSEMPAFYYFSHKLWKDLRLMVMVLNYALEHAEKANLVIIFTLFCSSL